MRTTLWLAALGGLVVLAVRVAQDPAGTPAAAGGPALEEIRAEQIAAHVQFLSDDLLEGRHVRMDFDRDLGCGLEAEVGAQDFVQALQLGGGEVRGRAAAEVQLAHLAARAEQAGDHLDLALQVLQVALDSIGAVRDLDRAPTKEAQPCAEGQVYVERERFVAALAGAPQRRARLGLADGLAPSGHGRIGGVAWPRSGEAQDLRLVDLQALAHGC
jgi:hypothetical protein